MLVCMRRFQTIYYTVLANRYISYNSSYQSTDTSSVNLNKSDEIKH